MDPVDLADLDLCCPLVEHEEEYEADDEKTDPRGDDDLPGDPILCDGAEAALCVPVVAMADGRSTWTRGGATRPCRRRVLAAGLGFGVWQAFAGLDFLAAGSALPALAVRIALAAVAERAVPVGALGGLFDQLGVGQGRCLTLRRIEPVLTCLDFLSTVLAAFETPPNVTVARATLPHHFMMSYRHFFLTFLSWLCVDGFYSPNCERSLLKYRIGLLIRL